MKPLHTPNEKIKMDVAGSCVLYVSKYFHLLLKFPLGVAKKSYRIVNTMVNLDSFYGETFPHPLKSLVSICSVTDKPKVLLNLPFCPARGFSAGWDGDGSGEAAPMQGAGPDSPPGLSPSTPPLSAPTEIPCRKITDHLVSSAITPSTCSSVWKLPNGGWRLLVCPAHAPPMVPPPD